MIISINEFKDNFEHYITFAQTENLFIMIDDEIIMELSNAKSNTRKIAKSLLGTVPDDITFEQSRDMKASEL